MRRVNFKPGDRVFYVGKEVVMHDGETLWGMSLVVRSVRRDHLSATAPNGRVTTWLDFSDLAIDEGGICAA